MRVYAHTSVPPQQCTATFHSGMILQMLPWAKHATEVDADSVYIDPFNTKPA